MNADIEENAGHPHGHMEGYRHIGHGFEPVYDERSRVLVLGSFPSVISRENGFYYGNPRNRFWPVLAACTGRNMPPHLAQEESIAAKKLLLLDEGIALWDVVESCDLRGSSDSTIRNVTPVPIERVLDKARIRIVLANGRTAENLYRRFLESRVGLEAIGLPSTSPANAAYSLARLTERWHDALAPYLERR
jgi:hypoxanthine-DNA glycosylase